jgi:hypothetical protein
MARTGSPVRFGGFGPRARLGSPHGPGPARHGRGHGPDAEGSGPAVAIADPDEEGSRSRPGLRTLSRSWRATATTAVCGWRGRGGRPAAPGSALGGRPRSGGRRGRPPAHLGWLFRGSWEARFELITFDIQARDRSWIGSEGDSLDLGRAGKPRSGACWVSSAAAGPLDDWEFAAAHGGRGRRGGGVGWPGTRLGGAVAP